MGGVGKAINKGMGQVGDFFGFGKDEYRNVNKGQTQAAMERNQQLARSAEGMESRGENEMNFARRQMFGTPGGGGGYAGGVIGAGAQQMDIAQSRDPNAAYRQFMSQSPGLQAMAMGNYSPLTQMLNAQAADQSQQSIRNTASQFADRGALNSGAAAAAMAEAGARPFSQVQAQLGQQQAGLAGQLMQQGFGQASQESMQDIQNRLRAAQALQQGYGQALGQAGNVYGTGAQMQQAGLSALGQSAGQMSQMGQPERVYQQSPFEKFAQVGQTGANLYGSFNKMGG
jgi:hypothetical protein